MGWKIYSAREQAMLREAAIKYPLLILALLHKKFSTKDGEFLCSPLIGRAGDAKRGRDQSSAADGRADFTICTGATCSKEDHHFYGFCGYFRCPKQKSQTTLNTNIPQNLGKNHFKKIIFVAHIGSHTEQGAFTCRFLGAAPFLESISLVCYFQIKSAKMLRAAL